ncbi:hypothetical protein BG011_006762 [Mortierella polycephala]|uniref:N-acetyltransferase domain-containing protein n=1 Tax=Mortierella polycephala TaxID=41804 RepID=A0A9P6UBB7_9FUNG|nr:hypothetical protein BG011_006762 [Mortierella polycephala]
MPPKSKKSKSKAKSKSATGSSSGPSEAMIVLETEYTNQSAIALYQQIGFIKDKRLYRYYLNGVDAFRLKLFCKPGPGLHADTAIMGEGGQPPLVQ